MATGLTRKDLEIVAIEFLLSLAVNTGFWNLVNPQISARSSMGEFTLTYFGIPIAATVLFYSIYLRRKRVWERNRPTVYHPVEPQIMSERTVVLMYGVEWVADVGYSIYSEGVVGAIDGPYCPKDNCRLVQHFRPNWIGSGIASWRCASCGSLYPRQKDRLGWEPHDVNNYAIKEYLTKKARENQKKD